MRLGVPGDAKRVFKLDFESAVRIVGGPCIQTNHSSGTSRPHISLSDNRSAFSMTKGSRDAVTICIRSLDLTLTPRRPVDSVLRAYTNIFQRAGFHNLATTLPGTLALRLVGSMIENLACDYGNTRVMFLMTHRTSLISCHRLDRSKTA